MQQSICEDTTRTTLRRMGYNSRRPHRVPLISITNRKKRLQLAHQNWTVEDWKNVALSDEFLLRHSDGRVRIWQIRMRTWIHHTCYHCVGWWWWCNLSVMFSWHTLGPL